MKLASTALLFFVSFALVAQVKSSYLFSTSMPYGTLDIRTNISSTNYYYLKEGATFAFRESSPGVKTNSFLGMTSWDSSPFTQGHLRHKTDTKDLFVMNYRLLPPLNYTSTYAEGYPLIVIVHGAVERGNCYYNNCYHSNWDYDPNVNSPAAPTSSTHKLLNNDHHLSIGGKNHLDARNLAAGKLPNDPTLASRAFPGFVLMAQMMNVWDENNIQDLIRLVRLHCKKYKIDQNRIYIHGLSIGGYGVYEAIKRAPWLFAAALPMSAVNDAKIFSQNMQSKLIHIPLWTFQGGLDTDPTPAYTNSLVDNWKKAGALPRYSLYSDLGHNVWYRAYSQSDFFSWMLTKNKSNLHAYAGRTVINKSLNQYPKLMLAEGFLAYQWEKDGVILSTTTNTLTITSPGKYRARFSRLSSAPTSSQWNKWSAFVTITETTATASIDSVQVVSVDDDEKSFEVFPNPSTGEQVNVRVIGFASPMRIQIVDALGNEMFQNTFDSTASQDGMLTIDLPQSMRSGLYFVIMENEGESRVRKLVVTRKH